MSVGAQATVLVNAGDAAFVTISSVLAIGFGVIGAATISGSSGQRHLRSGAILQTTCAGIVATIVFVIAGYNIGFGEIANGWFGKIALGIDLDSQSVTPGTALPKSVYTLLRLAFAVIAGAVLVGACAGRARFSWMIGFSGLWSLIVFAPIAHWLWGGGWLRAQIGAIDYAGGLVLHGCVGISALVIALLLGARDDPKTATENENTLPLMAGAGALLIAMLALNGASALGANHNSATAILSCLCAISASALAWMTLEKVGKTIASPEGLAKGVIAGLAAIAPASVYVSHFAAILIGLAAGIACFGIERRIRSLGIDDSASVFALNGVGGILGSLLIAIFLSSQWGGTGYFGASTMASQLGAQAIAIGAVIGWSAVGTAVTALLVSVLAPMRADN